MSADVIYLRLGVTVSVLLHAGALALVSGGGGGGSANADDRGVMHVFLEPGLTSPSGDARAASEAPRGVVAPTRSQSEILVENAEPRGATGRISGRGKTHRGGAGPVPSRGSEKTAEPAPGSGGGPAGEGESELGVGVSEVKVLRVAKPDYPRIARQRRLEGQVVYKVTIAPSGEIRAVELVKSSGSEILDEAARNAVDGSSFSPAMVAGKPVGGSKLLSYRFRLED